MNILVVDDEPDFRHLLTIHLEEEKDWKVLTAENGELALKALSQHKIDIIISDVYMPVIDGVKLYKEVRNQPEYTNTPFVFISGYDDPHTLSVINFSRNDVFIKKGNLNTEIKEWIRYLIIPLNERPLITPRMKLMERAFPQGRSYGRTDRLGVRAMPVYATR